MTTSSVLGYLGAIYSKESPDTQRVKTCFEREKSFDALSNGVSSSTSPVTLFSGRESPSRRQESDLAARSSESNSGYFLSLPSTLSDHTESFSDDQQLPIHKILFEIQQHLINVTDDETAADPSAMKESAVYFTPLVLRYWELLRLAEILRCQIKESLAKPYQLHCLQAKLERLEKKLEEVEPNSTEHTAFRTDKLVVEGDIEQLKKEICRQSVESTKNQAATKEALQSALVLTTALNIVLRHGMSADWLGDLWKLEDQRDEYRDMLCVLYEIEFDSTFHPIFSKIPSSAKTEQNRIEVNGISAWIESILSKLYQWFNDHVAIQRSIQSFHRVINPWRLGALRARRGGVFLIPFLNSETYNICFKDLDVYVRPFLAYFNWMFFLPRLTLNFTLLWHHVCNDAKLTHLEKNLDRATRLRAHWTRFWFEVASDIYWFSNSFALCFFVAGGAMSSAGICIRLMIQIFDLILSMTRAFIELRRLYDMSCALNYNPRKDNAESAMQIHLKQRLRFEAGALGYTVLHFWVLLIALCMTLPSMAAVSVMWPVIGSAISVLMTGITAHKMGSKDGFIQTRQRLFENKAAFYNLDDSEDKSFDRSPSKYAFTGV